MDAWEIRKKCLEAWEAGNYEEAFNHVMLLDDFLPVEPHYIFYAGIAHDAGKYDEGVRFALKGLQYTPIGLNPIDYQFGCYFFAGRCCEKKGDFDGALKYYRQARTLDPDKVHLDWDELCEDTEDNMYSQRIKAVWDLVSRFIRGPRS